MTRHCENNKFDTKNDPNKFVICRNIARTENGETLDLPTTKSNIAFRIWLEVWDFFEGVPLVCVYNIYMCIQIHRCICKYRGGGVGFLQRRNAPGTSVLMECICVLIIYTCICRHKYAHVFANIVLGLWVQKSRMFSQKEPCITTKSSISPQTRTCVGHATLQKISISLRKSRISPQKSPVLPHESSIPQHKSACVGRAARAYSYVLRKRALRHYTRA
jgi:hypothetical protein